MPRWDGEKYLLLHEGTILHSRVVWFSCFPCRKCDWYRCAIDPFKIIVSSDFHSKPWFSTFLHRVCHIRFLFLIWERVGRHQTFFSSLPFCHGDCCCYDIIAEGSSFSPVLFTSYRRKWYWRGVSLIRFTTSSLFKNLSKNYGHRARDVQAVFALEGNISSVHKLGEKMILKWGQSYLRLGQ